MALSVAGPAQAGKNNSAPIVYVEQASGQRISAERTTVFISPEQTRNDTNKANARIKFRYPGQAPSTQPKQTAKQPGPQTPRQYASIDTPILG